uniref:Adaptor related protein complex 1 subunit sigma 1 n=1 Tax=Ailuropoda melanoleuca TaxID=9646 RepID=A0A7N5KAS8_AILME
MPRGTAASGEIGVWEGRVSGSEEWTSCHGVSPCSPTGWMRFMLLFSRQGKLRLQKWYLATSDKERKKMVRELMQVVLARKPKMCSFLEWRDLKVVYKRYASLYFCCAIEGQDNELITLELIHRYVELLDKYFGSRKRREKEKSNRLLGPQGSGVHRPGAGAQGGSSGHKEDCGAMRRKEVCELDIIFNFEKAYFILDEFLMGGDVQDTSKKSVLKAIEQADLLQEVRARDSEEEEEYHDRGGPSFPGQLACQPQLPPSGRQGDPPACGVWPPRRPVGQLALKH